VKSRRDRMSQCLFVRYALSLGFDVLPLAIEVASTFHQLCRGSVNIVIGSIGC
jgi:hypothetical protein